MRNYLRENVERYRRMARAGGPADYEEFSSRGFLDDVIPRLRPRRERVRVLELGTGIGPGAIYLAERGFAVHAVDVIPEAIAQAQAAAAERGLDVRFEVMDVTRIPRRGPAYDLVVDSYCLQGIVLDADREAVFRAVGARLQWVGPAGRPLLPGLVIYAHTDGSFSFWDPARNYGGAAETPTSPSGARHRCSLRTRCGTARLCRKTAGACRICNGLIIDWAAWISARNDSHATMKAVIETLVSDGTDGTGVRVAPGGLARISIDDRVRRSDSHPARVRRDPPRRRAGLHAYVGVA